MCEHTEHLLLEVGAIKNHLPKPSNKLPVLFQQVSVIEVMDFSAEISPNFCGNVGRTVQASLPIADRGTKSSDISAQKMPSDKVNHQEQHPQQARQ